MIKMQTEQEVFDAWFSYPLEDADLINELEEIKNNPEEIHDRFYRELSFGTAGLRGVIGVGTNRMNIYTVRRATQGLAMMLSEKKHGATVAISYDSRIKSSLFAKEAACVLASNGINVYITNRLMPTPVLSYCVREIGCDAGIMITASHNPSKYNGYKVYGSDGSQLGTDESARVLEKINKTEMFPNEKPMSFETGLSKGLIKYVDEEVYSSYLSRVMSLSINPEVIEKAGLNLVYTPLNGTGNEPVRKVLHAMGVKNVAVVAQQEFPDGNFPTCPYPNPEVREALNLGVDLMYKKDADILIATDPDADRVGVVERIHGADHRYFSGNEIGVLLADYILSHRQKAGTLPKDAVVVKSLVSTALADRVCEQYGVNVQNVFTGFKYIGEEIRKLEEKGEQQRFVFGFEESCGYLCGDFVRDKDSVIATMLIVEMASAYKLEGKTLKSVYEEIEARHGVYLNRTESFSFEGSKGMKKMQGIMQNLRENFPCEIAEYKVLSVTDYLKSEKTDMQSGQKLGLELGSSNVLQLDLEQNCKIIVRPSGTEPKIKFYYTVVSDSNSKAESVCDSFALFALKAVQ